MAAVDEALASRISDDLLRLLFTACHPVNTPESQVALTLRTVAGLRTDEIARAFLTLGAEHGTTDLPGQEEPDPRRRTVRAAARRGASGTARCGARRHLSDLQRGVRGQPRGRLAPPGAVCGRSPARSPAGRAAGSRARGARAARADGAPGLPHPGPDRPERGAGAAGRPGPPTLGPAADPPRARLAASGRGPRRRPVHHPGPDRGLPCPGPPRPGHRLAADRRALHRAGLPDPLPGRRPEPRGRRRHGRRAGAGAGVARRARPATGPGAVSAGGRGPGHLPPPTRPRRRGPRGVRTRGGADLQRERAAAVPAPG